MSELTKLLNAKTLKPHEWRNILSSLTSLDQYDSFISSQVFNYTLVRGRCVRNLLTSLEESNYHPDEKEHFLKVINTLIETKESILTPNLIKFIVFEDHKAKHFGVLEHVMSTPRFKKTCTNAFMIRTLKALVNEYSSDEEAEILYDNQDYVKLLENNIVVNVMRVAPTVMQT